MTAVRRRALAYALVAVLAPAAVRADGSSVCQVVEVDFTPTKNLQIVAWLEDSAGTYVDTIYITDAVGKYGLGNRPGRFDFNSGPLWPYGRRITTFPVWAHRHGLTFPEVDFQHTTAHDCCGNENNLSHDSRISSPDPHYCKPRVDHQEGWDTMTCASGAGVGPYTDKGVFSPTATSLYPPRADLVPDAVADSADASQYKTLDVFDAISQATPEGGVPAEITWHVPPTLPKGNYVVWVEVAQETFDDDGSDAPGSNDNATYNATTYPSPMLQDFGDYGIAYRGQPSVVFSAPFAFGDQPSVASSSAYAGYGDPDGLSGTLNPPDDTITTAGGRLQLVADGSGSYRLRVQSAPHQDALPPGAPAELHAAQMTATSATLSFVAPGQDGAEAGGRVAKYEIHYQAYKPITDGNFAGALEVPAIAPDDPGQVQTVTLPNLLPDTEYSIGVRAIDACGNVGPLAITGFTTPDVTYGTVDACFVATAAYGSLMANDVSLLRGFRDHVLEHSALGELFVETYYTFGPPMAQVVGSSELLRATARDALGPAVQLARSWRPQ